MRILQNAIGEAIIEFAFANGWKAQLVPYSEGCVFNATNGKGGILSGPNNPCDETLVDILRDVSDREA